MQPTRRDALVTIAALAAASGVEAQTTFLSPAELDWLKALVDVIIPRTDTPGASDAGVPVFIDRRLAGNPRMTETFRSGMKALDEASQAKFGAAFPAVTAEQQVELLTSRQDDPFFRLVKGLTVDGYYTSEAGLKQELGWHGNTFLTEFKGCEHPEHQK
jgi:gluconate 2-dehydrogenase gamma chain